MQTAAAGAAAVSFYFYGQSLKNTDEALRRQSSWENGEARGKTARPGGDKAQRKTARSGGDKAREKACCDMKVMSWSKDMTAEKEKKFVVGLRQTSKLLERGELEEVLIAADADLFATKAVLAEAEARGVKVTRVKSKRVLGRELGIDISAAVAGRIRS